MQQVEIDRATIITGAEKGSPRTRFSADFSEKIANHMRGITAATEQSAPFAPTKAAHPAARRASSATSTSRAGPAT